MDKRRKKNVNVTTKHYFFYSSVMCIFYIYYIFTFFFCVFTGKFCNRDNIARSLQILKSVWKEFVLI